MITDSNPTEGGSALRYESGLSTYWARAKLKSLKK
jgi:hypothetical protein